MKSAVQSWRPRTNAFCDFSARLSKVLCLPRTSEARSYEVLDVSHKIILASLTIWWSKMQPLSGNLLPDMLTANMSHMSVALRVPCEIQYICADPLHRRLALQSGCHAPCWPCGRRYTPCIQTFLCVRSQRSARLKPPCGKMPWSSSGVIVRDGVWCQACAPT